MRVQSLEHCVLNDPVQSTDPEHRTLGVGVKYPQIDMMIRLMRERSEILDRFLKIIHFHDRTLLENEMHDGTHYTVEQREIHKLYNTDIGSIIRSRYPRFFTGVAIFFLLAVVIFHFPVEVAGANPTIDEIMSMTPFKPKDTNAVRKGRTISTGLSVVSDREIGGGIACLIKDNQVNPLLQFGKGQSLLPDNIVTSIGIIPEKANLDSFSPITLGKDSSAEAVYYRQFEGAYGLNLSVREIERFRSISDQEGGGVEEFEKVIREQLYDRYTAYRKNGIKGIFRYIRDGDYVTDPADELKQSLKVSTTLEKIFPKYYYAWWNFPESMPSGANESYSWYILNLNKRPAVMLAHRIEDGYAGSLAGEIIGERYFYASRFLNVGYAIAALIPVEEGRLFVYGYRIWIDEWRGLSSFKHSVGQKMMIKRMKKHLKRLEICK